MRKLHALVALLALLAVPAVARAQTSVSVLGFEPIEVPEDVTNLVTTGLRVRAATAKLRVVPGKPLVEMKLVFGCLDEAPTCMAQIGSSLQAEKLLYGAVRKSRTGYSVTLKYLDVAKARIENEQTFQLVKSDAREASLRPLIEKWFAAVTGVKSTGMLRITPSVAGARVTVDDVVIGTSSGLAPVVASDLRPGKHEIVVTAPKHKRFSASVRLAAGETLEVNAQLEREEEPLGPTGPTGIVAPTGPTGIVAPTGPTTERPGGGARIAAWTTGGSAVAAYIVGIVAAVRVKSLGNDKLKQMQSACSADPNGPACLRVMPECAPGDTSGNCYYNVQGNDACAAANSPRKDGAGQRNPKVADLCSEGKSWATATWVVFPIAGALTALSGYFFWSGYFGKKPVDKEKHVAARLRLRFEPVVGPGISAVMATFNF
jgi:hypothetical protein